MESVKRYLVANFEDIFVLLILGSVLLLNYFIPYKIAFLNFYFIPILVGAYYLGVRKALLGSLLCALVVTIFALFFPDSFSPPAQILSIGGHDVNLHLWMSIVTWSSFLILTSAVVGKLTTRLKEEISQVTALNVDLEASKTTIESAEEKLRDHAENLEKKVAERTDSLARSKQAVEELKKKVEEALYSTMDASVVRLII